MKRVHKNILGISGLVLVAGMTACAALIPSPEAAAVGSSVTDTLVVKVIENNPVVRLSSPLGNNAVITAPFYDYDISFNHVENIEVVLKYVDLNGNVHTYVDYKNTDANYQYFEESLQLDLVNLVYDDGTQGGPGCFGYYTLTAKSIGSDGTEPFDVLEFRYAGVAIGDIEDGKDTGGGQGPNGPVVDGCHDGYNSCGDTGTGEDNGDQDDEDGPLLWIPSVASNVNLILIKTMNGEIVGRAEGDFTAEEYRNGFYIRLHLNNVSCQEWLMLEAYRVTNGDYANATLIYAEKFSAADTCIFVPNTGAPDTGGLFQDLNISKEDYLITGLIVFFVLGIVGFGVVTSNHKSATTRRRR